ncbi:ABC transporter ATP-binding protein [Thioflexithrix psekupsensis]|uniref:ABC transporter n=1 Tax=Thioflexithrix psekupsensis TaxID=1570016 RepID=A0A251X950_9GAMM|nr:ABC transporter ATP-binding protein [Thioflexithrix psekupsensis]OUD14588.1 ABC transporter [Thioflexithrix psekupsensis]
MSALTITDLWKTYKNGFTALKGIDLTVKQGDFFALLGPNGAGKSTTIGIISGLVRKTKGEVSIFDHTIDSAPEWARAKVGLVPQEFNFNQFEPVLKVVMNQAGYYGVPRRLARERATFYLKTLGLWDKRDQETRSLSGGMKRRLMVARALAHEPDLLILDEPTAGVDIELRRSMWAFLKNLNAQGKTIILTTHYLEEAESLCPYVAIIDRGVIVENTTMKQLLSQLHLESFVLDLRTALPPHFTLPEVFNWRSVDEHTLVVELDKSLSLNRLFTHLSAQHVEVVSMRNQANRLEELFLRKIEKNDDVG